MEEESASEAIDKDIDPEEDKPDSMDILMGEIEMPYDSRCDIQTFETKNTKFSKVSNLSQLSCINAKKEIKSTVETTKLSKLPGVVNLKSLKQCQGYAHLGIFEIESLTENGFVRNGQLKRTLSGTEPMHVPKQVTYFLYLMK